MENRRIFKERLAERLRISILGWFWFCCSIEASRRPVIDERSKVNLLRGTPIQVIKFMTNEKR